MAEQHRSEEDLDQTSDDKLEEDVKLMAEKIAEFRDTLPDQLQNTLASILSAQRPVNFNRYDDAPGPSSINPNPESGRLVDEDLAHAEKIQRIKQKISSNASAMSAAQLKRMKDCMSRIDKLDSFNNGIHPAFKRSKITSEDCFIGSLPPPPPDASSSKLKP
ncbi:hypothetical protein L1987_28614 [Smallanthus sonchifolius]|uniref:Uncharacterized protein n=1 Tax=Smallanthus sonchifolius TaxID=185202 RepID=A0ACB9HYW6_9ASTR|nr:hypothetical protein L1987_28614 [Smallanthus sonchifolius]